jgi:type IV pilus assembly protein PilW
MRNIMRSYREFDGFTLVELLITMLISGIIIAAIYSSYIAQQRTYLAQEQVIYMQQNIRAGLEVIGNEIRMAGYDPSGNSNADILPGTNSRIILFSQDLNEDGDALDAGETLTFALGGTDGNNDGVVDNIDVDGNGITDAGSTITRDNGGGAQPVALNIQALEFFYTLKDDTKVLNPTTSQLDKIKSVQISILAVAEQQDRNFMNSRTYYPGSNPSGSATGTTWGPFNDNFRRRLLTYNINCRNMGL